MKKKPYVKPDIKEESYILTVTAWVTQTPILTRRPELAERVTKTPIFSRIFTRSSRFIYRR